MRGPQPRPAEEKRARGNPGKRKIVEAPVSLVAPHSTATAPKKLSALGRKVWDQLAPRLQEMRFLRESDTPAFARYCSDLAKWWECELDIRKRGLTYTTSSKHVADFERVNPMFLVQERIERRLIAQEDRFGLSPSARQRLMLQLAGTPGGLPLGGGKPKDEESKPNDGALDLEPAAPLIGGLNAASNAIN